MSGNIPQGNPRHKYVQGDDGRWYNSDGERVYYWVRPFEGDEDYMNGETQGIGTDLGGYYTEAEIKAAYGNVLEEQTGSWDNYWGYISERQSLIESGELVDPIQGGYYQQAKDDARANTDPEDSADSDRPEEVYYAQIGANTQRSQADQMSGWVDQNAGLMEKYGIAGEYTNDNGDVYRFNGSTYVREYLAPNDSFLSQMAPALIMGAFGAGALGPAIAGGVGGIGGAALPAGVAGPAAPLLSTGVSNAIAAGATTAATQGMLNGEIDPGSVLASAVIGGLNPGGYVADNYAPWRHTDPFTGETSWALGGAPPSSFYGGLVSGTVNDVVANGLINQDFDLGDSLVAGLQSGAINSALNAYDEWKNNSLDGLADEYQFNNPDATRQEALDWAANQTDRLNKIDFGALIGDDGLLPFVPELDTTLIRSITDPIGDAVDGLLNGFSLGDVIVLKDGTRIPASDLTSDQINNYVYNQGATVEYDRTTVGLINNPITNAAGDLLGSLIGSSDSPGSDLQAQYDYFAQEFKDRVAGPDDFDANGNLTVAGQVAQNQYVQTKLETLGSFFYENSGGLNENYSWSPNPRGDSELWGTLAGIPGLYSTGGVPYVGPGGKSVTSPILDANGNVTDPLKFGPEFIAPGYQMGVDPADATLPSNDETAFRNYNLLNLFDLLNGGANADSGNETAGNQNANADTNNQSVNTGGNTGGDSDANAGDDTSTTGSALDATGADTVNDELAGSGSEVIDDAGSSTNAVSTDAASTDDVAGNAEDVLATGESTLPTGGGGGSIDLSGKDGLPPLWTELFGYTKISPYKKARLRVLEGMLGGMLGGGVGNFNDFQFGANKNPYQKIEKSLYEAGIKE